MVIPAGKLSLVVSLSDFVGLLKALRYGVKLGKRNIAREVAEFDFDGANLIVSMIGARQAIPASGSWQGKVAIALPIMSSLRRVPPSQDPLIISYENSKLKIGTTKVSAEWLP